MTWLPSGPQTEFLHPVCLWPLSASLQVIRPETCLPCGKRIRFGKMALKCRNCRAAIHPECKLKFTDGCSATAPAGSLAQQVPPECFKAHSDVIKPHADKGHGGGGEAPQYCNSSFSIRF